MKALLTALQEGRLVELPDNIKTDALEFLGALLEAVPEVPSEEGITEKALAREKIHNTGIGKGWACPHATTDHEGELLCSVGWSPQGINYGSPDGVRVHLIVMYFVPDSQRNAYLKEISQLAKAIHQNEDLQKLQELTELSEVRHALLDAITHAIESVTPESRARMIQLEVRHAAVEAGVPSAPLSLDSIARSILPVSIIVVPGAKPLVLAQDRDLVENIELIATLAEDLEKSGHSASGDINIVLKSTEHYAPNRMLHDCVAFRGATKPA
ncbi:MAG: PTS sugar transporter subunit IIA [Verrucomicrobia bacterium]|nr:PTS sugar transporter subunit IIA [Verrucomicrobiota bacterium]